jgi:predicted membrane protein
VVRLADEGAIEDEYRLGIGNLVVDLRGLEPEELDRQLEVAVGIGYAEVIVPEDVRVRVEGSAAAGYVQLFGRERDGTSVDLAVTDGPVGDDVLVLEADVRLGALEVRRG